MGQSPSFPNARNVPSLLCHERFNEASLPVIQSYCLENDIIKLDDIKCVNESSLSLQNVYYNKSIDYCYKDIENYNELAISSIIGIFQT